MHALLRRATEIVAFWMIESETKLEEKGKEKRKKNMKVVWFRFRKKPRNQKQIYKHELDIYYHYYSILQWYMFLKSSRKRF